jgi:hypothetical protein
MTTPVQHGIPVGCYLPYLIKNAPKQTELEFRDVYSEVYKPLGIARQEMMVITSNVMRVDVLSGNDEVGYFTEYGKDKDNSGKGKKK